MRKAITFYVASLLVMVSVFQNCSRTEFSSSSSSAPADAANAATSDPGAGSTTDPSKTDPGSQDPPISNVPNPTPVTPDPTPTVPPSLVAIADPAVVPKGARSLVSVTATGLTSTSYSCTTRNGSNSVTTGTLTSASGAFLVAPVNEDTTCVLTGVGPNLTAPVSSTLNITVDCGSQFKIANGTCRDFSCTSVERLNSMMNVPARTAEGKCYAYQLMPAIESGASSLTPNRDLSLYANSHDAATKDKTLHPYLMASVQTQFMLAGARTVKLSGGVNANAPILVDNFVLAGVFPTGTQPDVTVAYRVYGTSDAAIILNGVNTKNILFNQKPLPVLPFGGAGTASIAPVDITGFATPNVPQTLDVRALDCGNTRQLSDIYVLFQ